MIEIVCYSHIERWHSRKAAIAFYKEGAFSCEGAERDRYIEIVFDLEEGCNRCHDRSSFSYEECERRGWFYKTNAPDGTRDYGGKIWYSRN